MSEVFEAVSVNPGDFKRIQNALENIRQVQSEDGDLLNAISAAVDEFNKFFLSYGKPAFAAKEFRPNETAQSSEYNENLLTLKTDIERLYELSKVSSDATLTAFNYATVAANEINSRAGVAASKVLDLNILSDFIKGTTIVAGDDFIDDSKIDFSVGLDTEQAQLLKGASSLSLKTVDVENVTGPDTVISITPVAPAGESSSVNTDPTPLNLERFYEGQFYADPGEQRPEGGFLELRYIVDPSKIPNTRGKSVSVNGIRKKDKRGGSRQLREGSVGFYAVVQPTEEDKQAIRRRMVDGNPSTFWECEYIYEIPDISTLITAERETKLVDGQVE